MAESGVGRIFKHGRSQAVRLPKEFRLPGDRVRVRRMGSGILLEPISARKDWDAWFAQLDRLVDPDFMKDGRDQPPMPRDDPDEMFD